MCMSCDIKLLVMRVDFPVGIIIFNEKMGKIWKTAFLTYFIKSSQNFVMKNSGSIYQGSRSQGAGNLESHTKGENFLITEVLLILVTNMICLISEVTCNSGLQHKLIRYPIL
jgi:hypothetical protein